MRIGWSKTDKEIIHKISIDEMIPEKEVELMIAAQFLILRETMENRNVLEEPLLSIMLPRFGKFYFNKWMVRKYRENNGKPTEVVRHDD